MVRRVEIRWPVHPRSLYKLFLHLAFRAATACCKLRGSRSSTNENRPLAAKQAPGTNGRCQPSRPRPFAEDRGGMKRILLKQGVLLVCQGLDALGQPPIAIPKLGYGVRAKYQRRGWPSERGRDRPSLTCFLTLSSNSIPAPPCEKSRSISSSQRAGHRSTIQSAKAVCSWAGSSTMAC